MLGTVLSTFRASFVGANRLGKRNEAARSGECSIGFGDVVLLLFLTVDRGET